MARSWPVALGPAGRRLIAQTTRVRADGSAAGPAHDDRHDDVDFGWKEDAMNDAVVRKYPPGPQLRALMAPWSPDDADTRIIRGMLRLVQSATFVPGPGGRA